jgi:hypothetical protein
MFELIQQEKDEVVTICEHLQLMAPLEKPKRKNRFLNRGKLPPFSKSR